MHPHHCEESTPLWKVIQKDDNDKDDAESKDYRAILLQVEKSGLSHFPRKATF